MTIPQVEIALPELTQFVTYLASQQPNGALSNWQVFSQRVREFYTSTMMDRVEWVVPGWRQMASYADQQTLIHVTAVLTALFLLPEYQRATAEQQMLMQWMVLFHDVAKRAHHSQHDYIHGFRSAAVTGRGLAQAGFPATEGYPELIDEWALLTDQAIIFRDDLGEMVQDNRKLPEIISGIDDLFGLQSPAGLIIKGVLLHVSVVTDPDYPTVAPMTDSEFQQYIDPLCFPLFKMMLLVDADGWNLFDPQIQQRHRQQTLAVFDRLETLIGL